MYIEDCRELKHLRKRREELKIKLADSCNARKAAKERGDEKTISRERKRAAYLAAFITRLNDEIFALEKAVGAEPEDMGTSEPAQI